MLRAALSLEKMTYLPDTGMVMYRSSLTSLQQRLFKTGGRLFRHARYFVLQLAESHLTGRLFRQILRRASGASRGLFGHAREQGLGSKAQIPV